MNFICIGKLVNTHGIKGEVRLLSDFEKKTLVFKKDFILYLGPEKEKVIINTYRPHKNFDMVTFCGINDINDVLKYKGLKVYINKDDLKLPTNDYILSDLIGFKITDSKNYYGTVKSICTTKSTPLLTISYDKSYYIPHIPEFITKINFATREITVERVGELL